MNTKEFDTLEEAKSFTEDLMSEKKWAITVIQTTAGKYLAQWIEHKKYTARDGLEYLDEVWTTVTGEMKLVQDLEPEHARNVIRMMLRQDREAAESLNALVQQLAAENEDKEWDDMEPPFPGSTPNKALH